MPDYKYLWPVSPLWLMKEFSLSLSLFCLLEPEPKKGKKGGAKAEKEADGPILYQDPPDKLASPSGKKYTLKITSWNVDGLRAWVKKKGLEVMIKLSRPGFCSPQ